MRRCFMLFGGGALLLTACLGPADVGIGLPTTSSGFCESMRWSDFQSAAVYLVPEVRENFLEQFREDEDLKIVSSRVIKVDVGEDEGFAGVLYQMEYYRLPSNSIKKWRWEQRWVLVRENMTKPGVWLIENAPPALPWNQ